ncbi:MAG: ABC transporter permease [Candidatus Thermoplasmatota archaeon]|nr:ABC transporter permease [Candidatus Thermoplasmatota archaeon]
MIILVRKAARDLLRHKLRTVSIVIAIALSVGLGIGLVNATKDAFDSFDRRLEVTNYEDIDIQFDMTVLDLDEIRSIEGVGTVVERTFMQIQVDFGSERYKTHWLSAPYYENKPYSEINGYQIVKGRSIGSPDAREALVGHLFAEANNVMVGDTITVYFSDITVDLVVVGIAASPEYIYVVSNEGWPEPSLLLPLFTTSEMTRSVLGMGNDTCNELLVRVSDGADKEKVKEALESYLTRNGVRITSSLLGTQENDYLFSRTDANAMGQMGWIFGTIILVVTAVVIYNSMTRLIASQRAYIGVMGALGGRMRSIIAHYSLFGLFMGSIGALLGIPIGIGISVLTVSEYANIIGLADPVLDIYWLYILIFSLIGISIATAGAFLGSLKAVSVGPREALTSQYNTLDFSKKPILERLFDLIAYKRPILPRIPMRNLSRHKLRTGITVFSLGVSLLLVFSCLALALGFLQPLKDNYSKYEKWDLKANLVDPIPGDEARTLLEGPGFQGTGAEVILDDHVSVMNKGKLDFARVQAFGSDSKLRDFHVIDGRMDPSNGILVGSILSRDLGIGVGDEVEFVLGNTTMRARISGITGELMDDSFLMTLEQASSILQTNGSINGVILDLNTNSRDQLESTLRETFTISSIMYTDDVQNGMESLLQGLIAMFFIFIAFGVISEVLFISTTVVLNILDREMEFISLRAIGTKPGRIRRMIVLETLILLSGGLIIGLPLGVLTTKWAMAYLVKDLMYYVIRVDPMVFIITMAIAVLSAVMASYISARHITKAKLADTIRQRAIT